MPVGYRGYSAKNAALDGGGSVRPDNFVGNQTKWRENGCARLIAPVPLGATLSDFSGWKPSELPSPTQSGSAFLPGQLSMGAPPHRQRALRALAHPSGTTSSARR